MKILNFLNYIFLIKSNSFKECCDLNKSEIAGNKNPTMIYNIWFSGKGRKLDFDQVEEVLNLYNVKKEEILKKFISFENFYSKIKFDKKIKVKIGGDLEDDYFKSVETFLKYFPKTYEVVLILDKTTLDTNIIYLKDFCKRVKGFKYLLVDYILENSIKAFKTQKFDDEYFNIEYILKGAEYIKNNASGGYHAISSNFVRWIIPFCDKDIVKDKNYVYMDLDDFVAFVQRPTEFDKSCTNFGALTPFEIYGNFIYKNYKFKELQKRVVSIYREPVINWIYTNFFRITQKENFADFYYEYLEMVYLKYENEFSYYISLYDKLIVLTPLIELELANINTIISYKELSEMSENELKEIEKKFPNILKYFSFDYENINSISYLNKEKDLNRMLHSAGEFPNVDDNELNCERCGVWATNNSYEAKKLNNSIFEKSKCRLIEAENLWYKKVNPFFDIVLESIAVSIALLSKNIIYFEEIENLAYEINEKTIKKLIYVEKELLRNCFLIEKNLIYFLKFLEVKDDFLNMIIESYLTVIDYSDCNFELRDYFYNISTNLENKDVLIREKLLEILTKNENFCKSENLINWVKLLKKYKIK